MFYFFLTQKDDKNEVEDIFLLPTKSFIKFEKKPKIELNYCFSFRREKNTNKKETFMNDFALSLNHIFTFVFENVKIKEKSKSQALFFVHEKLKLDIKVKIVVLADVSTVNI